MGTHNDPLKDAGVTLEELQADVGFGFLKKVSFLVGVLAATSVFSTILAWQAMPASGLKIASVTLGAFASLLALGGLTWLHRGKGPVWRLSYLSDTMSKIAAGELKTPVYREGNDEIARMGKAQAVLRNVAWQAKEANERAAQEKERADRERREAELSLADNFDSSIGGDLASLLADVSKMRQKAEEMSSLAGVSSSESQTVADTIHGMASDIDAVSAASNQLSSSIVEISRQVSHSATISQDAVSRAQQMNANIQSLENASQKIGEVVSLINDIAEQTNLLALNATIEAARAGEAGKGFAVVASEVKNLASQTTNATDEIGAQIASIQAEISDAVRATDEIGGVIGEMDEISSKISAAVEQQGSATQEIGQSVDLAAKSSEEISARILEVSRSSSQTGQAADEVKTTASELDRLTSNVSREIKGFLDNIRKR